MTETSIHRSIVCLAVMALVLGCGTSGSPTSDAEAGKQAVAAAAKSVAGEPEKAGTSSGVAQPEPGTEIDREAMIALAERLAQQGDLTASETKLRSLLLVEPSDVVVLFRLANLAFLRGDLADAVEILETIPADDPQAGIAALGQAADWSVQLQRYADAESKYLQILERIPDAAMARRKLAFLYNRQGRRHEAAEQVYQLCRLGDVRQDELHSLIQLGDAMYDPPSENPAADDEHRYVPIGDSGRARKLFMEERFLEAVDELHPSVAAGQQPPSIVALYGRAAAEAQDDERFDWWLGKTDKRTAEYSEYWAALGAVLLAQRQPEPAIRALLEAVNRDPRDFRSIARLRSALLSLGRVDDAETWSERWKTLRDLSSVNNRIADSPEPNAASMLKLASLLESLDRKLEAVLWRSLAAYYQRASPDALASLQAELRRLGKTNEGLPNQAARICEMDLDAFPLPSLEPKQELVADGAAALPTVAIHPQAARLENVAASVGLTHSYQVAANPQERGFSVYQSVGGAVAVVDYDLDGKADLYFCQGGADPPDFVGRQSNVLYRNLGPQLADVTEDAKATQRRYSTGATVGDWNQDGFADIVVANIGKNSLWINSGDGTFRQVDVDDGDDKTLLTTSLAMGDLDGDAVPDVFELNYLHDPELSKRPGTNQQGEVVESLMPSDFNPGIDRLILNDGRGKATSRSVSDSDAAASLGLGVILGDLDGAAGNEVFVGNDTDPNQLWIREANEDRWVDVAMARGCAFGFDGVATASMGVAAGDFDRNGFLDFHVTNFQDEYVSLFLNEDGLYQDRNVRFGLSAPSDSVLGFGTQAIDYDNDGLLDLVVANGHIDDAITLSAPFRQPPQLFGNLGNRFELAEVADSSAYWRAVHVGRGLARLDFNRDGRMDFVVTHLGETSALMVNGTETGNHWLQLQLVGTQSERDAIGARIELRTDGEVQSQWVVSGDGFLCRNEAVVAFGLGTHTRVDEIEVRWPSGRRQTLTDIPADHRLLIIEGIADASELW